jgi:uncharacterized repeat protein (TIGR04076 family)
MVKTPFPKLKLTVTKVTGKCYHGYDIGDELVLEDFTHPPEHFCLGLAHAVFPCIYSLSFAGHFPFMDNQRSIKVTCPDGGKLEFKAEVLDPLGNVSEMPKDPDYEGPKPRKMVAEVVKSDGTCFYGYKVGDRFEFEGLKTLPGMCGAAYHLLFPALFALNFGSMFFFMEDPDTLDTVTCPDGGKIVFKVSRISDE